MNAFSVNEQMVLLVEMNVYVSVDMVMLVLLDIIVSFGMGIVLVRRSAIVFVELMMVWMYFWMIWWSRMMSLHPI